MRDNVQRRFIQPKLAEIGLGWVVAADQRGHGLGVALEVSAQADLEQKLQAVRTLDSEVIQ